MKAMKGQENDEIQTIKSVYSNNKRDLSLYKP